MEFMPPGHAALNNVMFSPLNIEGKTVGIMGLANKPEPFTEEDRAMAEALGQLAAIALQNSRYRANMEERDKEQRQILEATTDGIWKWNFLTHEMFLSPRYYEMLGYKPNEFPPNYESWVHLLHPDDRSSAQEFIKNYLKAETDTYENEYRCRGKDGTYRWIRAKARMIERGPGGEPVLMIGNHEDISDRKQSEEALTRLKEAVLQASEAIIITSPDGIITFANPAFESITGYLSNETVGQNPRILKSGRHDQAFYAKLWNTVLSGQRWSGRIVNRRKDGRLYTAECSISPVKDQNGHIVNFVWVTRDITTELQLEEKLSHAQKMEAIGTLAGGIAHDFNNILVAITGYTEMAMDDNPPEVRNHCLQNALKGAERAKNLVRQILTFSRQTGQERKPLDMKPLLKEAVKFLRASIPATIEIQQSMTNDPCNILADPTQMHQIIMNLCTNAVHAMKKAGGILKVELVALEGTDGEILPHPDLKPGPYVRLTVSDTGHGIEPAYMERIFDPFFTTKTELEGTGLGLSVVYGIVKSHDGFINVYSEVEKGTRVNVYLPGIIHETPASEIIPVRVAGGKERILFVDDEEPIVDLGTRILLSLGYEVTGTASSGKALELFRAGSEAFDLVMTDMTLPKMTGIELSREILQIRPDIPIILWSGIREADTEEQARSLGIRAYCMKPMTRRELARVIRSVLDGHENLFNR